MPEEQTPFPSWLTRGMADLFPCGDVDNSDQNLAARLDAGLKLKKPLRIKLGIDPTSSSIHLGHSILFRKLRAFQDAGHTAVLIIGDFTAQIGDPTGKSITRVQLTSEEVEQNSETYLNQLGLGKPPGKAVLDFETPGLLEIHRNSEWFKGLDLSTVIELLGKSTVGQMLAKEDFAKRYSSGTAISLHEFLYPLLQGYDSVMIRADVELGGTDQKFNVAMGRDLQRHFKQKPQFGFLLPILAGLDGSQKMSKSLGNTVGIDEDPISMYSKLEKVPDNIVRSYVTLLTDLELDKLPENPRELQRAMALAVTETRHGSEAAKSAQISSAALVSGRLNIQADVPEVSISEITFPIKAFYLLSSLRICVSSSDARRKIEGGAVRIDGEKITNPNLEFSKRTVLLGKVLQLGKKTFRRFIN